MASRLPSAGRNTRPIICRNKPIFFVGRARMQHPTSGMSQPSVRTMQFVTSSISPEAKRPRIASRSGFGVEPSMCSARTPAFTNSSRRWIECRTLTAKQTVFRRSASLSQCMTMSPTSLSRSIRSASCDST